MIVAAYYDNRLIAASSNPLDVVARVIQRGYDPREVTWAARTEGWPAQSFFGQPLNQLLFPSDSEIEHWIQEYNRIVNSAR